MMIPMMGSPVFGIAARLSISGTPHTHVVYVAMGGNWVVQSVVGGLIGGAAVLVGVLVAEWFQRRRERAARFDDALLNLFTTAHAVQREARSPGGAWDASMLMFALVRVHNEARPPLPNAKAISAEVQNMFIRYHERVDTWKPGEGFPSCQEIIGDEIVKVARRPDRIWNV